MESKEEPMAFVDSETGKRYVRSWDDTWVEVKDEDHAAVRQEDDGTR